jgi:hypothetical protein
MAGRASSTSSTNSSGTGSNSSSLTALSSTDVLTSLARNLTLEVLQLGLALRLELLSSLRRQVLGLVSFSGSIVL